jgi:type III pantothenate kinase
LQTIDTLGAGAPSASSTPPEQEKNVLLTVDVGNTQTTIGLFDEDGSLVRQWRMATDSTDTADELHERLFGYFQMFDLALDSVTDVAIASVVPILTQEWQYMMTNLLKAEDILIVDATRDCGIAIDMPDPRQVGADRIANALAARATYGAPVIVVDFGTATNIDVVDRAGNFRGGAIMPGLLLSAQSLFSRAAKLSSVPLVAPEHALGDSTETAVQSGIVIGAAAQAEGLVRRIMAELGETEKGLGADQLTVVGTGGFSRVVAAATDVFDAIDPDLTVRGIYQIWKHRADKRASRE